VNDSHQTVFIARVLRSDLAITTDDGEMVARSITSDSGLTLDFSGIRAYAVPFFAALVGTRFDFFSRAVIVNGLDGVDLVFRRVIKNNREYLTDERVRRAVDAILAEAEGDL